MVCVIFLVACGEDPQPAPPAPAVLAIEVLDGRTLTPLRNARVIPVHDVVVGRALDLGDGGTHRSDVEPGPYSFWVAAPGYVSSPRPGLPGPSVTASRGATVTARILLEPTGTPSPNPPGAIDGTVTEGGSPVAGALVLASATRQRAARTDADGRYRILGASPNLYRVKAYVGGRLSSEATNVDVASAAVVEGVDLTLEGAATGRVSGTLGAGTGGTTVALILEATGDSVPGLSGSGTFDGTYEVQGVPPGAYRVTAATEKDGAVLQPNPRHGSAGVPITVTASSALDLDLPMVPAIALTVPTSTVTGDSVFEWVPVPQTTFYVVELTTGAGQLALGGFDSRFRPRATLIGHTTSVTLRALVGAGPPLDAGGLYRLRLIAAVGDPMSPSFSLVAATEDLDGWFRLAR